MAACASCRDPLVIGVGETSDGPPEEVIPDDLLLPCGCHFHWQCLLDEATQVASSIQCPSCAAYLAATQAGTSSSSSSAVPSGGVQILTRYVNEGGLQDNYDILPDLTEEAHLLAHPEARPAQAFLTMCAAGDVMGIVSLLSDDDDDDDDDEEMDDDELPVAKLAPEDLLRYQDPLHGLPSGLHVAVQNDQEEVFYLLLYLASRLPHDRFPPAVLQAVEQAGLVRPASIASHADIRGLHDQSGETAQDYAAKKGGAWAALAQTDIFAL